MGGGRDGGVSRDAPPRRTIVRVLRTHSSPTAVKFTCSHLHLMCFVSSGQAARPNRGAAISAHGIVPRGQALERQVRRGADTVQRRPSRQRRARAGAWQTVRARLPHLPRKHHQGSGRARTFWTFGEPSCSPPTPPHFTPPHPTPPHHTTYIYTYGTYAAAVVQSRRFQVRSPRLEAPRLPHPETPTAPPTSSRDTNPLTHAPPPSSAGTWWWWASETPPQTASPTSWPTAAPS